MGRVQPTSGSPAPSTSSVLCPSRPSRSDSERVRSLHGSLRPILLAAVLTAGLAAICRGQGPAADSPPAAFTIRADWFDRGNVRVSTPGQRYADKFACIWNAGELPNRAEYDVDFPVSGDYTIAALFAARTPRPVEIYLDGEKVVEGFTGATGSWQTSQARWETQGTVHIEKGRRTIKLLCAGPMPFRECQGCNGNRSRAPQQLSGRGRCAADRLG